MLTSAVGMGSNEQVEVLALATSLAMWIVFTGEKAVRWGAMRGWQEQWHKGRGLCVMHEVVEAAGE